MAGPPYDDVVPFARRIVETYPDRVLWGSDWPHPNLTSHMPDDGALVAAEAMLEVLTNEPLRTDLVERGRVRLRHFHPDNARAILLDHLSRLA